MISFSASQYFSLTLQPDFISSNYHTMKKKQFLFLSTLLCSLMLLFTACNGSGSKKDKADDDDDDTEAAYKDNEAAYEKLRRGAESANAQCPVSLGIMGEMSSITLDDDLLLFSYDIDEDYFNVATLAEDRQAMKDNMKTMLSSPQDDVKELLEQVIEANCRLKVTIHGKTTDAVASATFKADELDELLNTEVSPQEKLATAIASTQSQLPLNVDAGMTITQLKQEGDDVVYIVKMDESMYDISMVRQNKAVVRETIMQNIRNMGPVEREFIKLVANSDANLVYRYTTSAGHIDIKITNEELKESL